MKSNRSSFHLAMAASLLLGFSGLALAQAPVEAQAQAQAQTQARQTGHTHKVHANMADRHARHLTDLKAKLKLDAAQEPAWTAFAQTLQAPMSQTARLDRAALASLTTPERLDLMKVRQAARDGEVRKRVEATKAFYATLEPVQKKIFDTETAQAMHGMGHKMGHSDGFKTGVRDAHPHRH